MWQYQGKQRPDFAQAPGPDQESVWDYPRPPAVERTDRRVQVIASGITIADTTASFRLMETASPPTYYIPMIDVDLKQLLPVDGKSMCEWKGLASYFALPEDPGITVAWGYPDARAPYTSLRDCLSFYPGRIECLVAGERVQPQPGLFYGGWVTSDIVGPFKGEPCTVGW